MTERKKNEAIIIEPKYRTKGKQEEMINTYISITLKINDFDSSMKRQGLVKLLKKQNLYPCCPHQAHVNFSDMHHLKVKR